jgi:hypothetical protein
VCERDALAACKDALPPGLLGHSDRACQVLVKLPDAGKKKARRILDKALRQWGKLGHLLDRPKAASQVSAECRSALEAFLADASERALRVRGEVGGG